MRPDLKRKKRAKQAEDQRQADVRTIMGTLEGRRFIWRLLGMAGVFGDTGNTDPVLIGRFLGRRSLGHEIFAEVCEVCPEDYLLMQREAMEAEDLARQEEELTKKEEEANA